MVKPAKKTPARKRPAKRRTPGAPAALPEKPAPADPDFELLEPAGIRWRIKGTTYVLGELTVGDYQDLDWLYRGGSVEYRAARAEAMAMPAETDDERSAKIAALDAAEKIANRWLLGWWERLFKAAEEDTQPFPTELAPSWILRPGVPAKVLDHLQGKSPLGVD